MPDFHPELASLARFLPYGVARWWTVPLLHRLMPRLLALVGSKGTEVALEGCSVFVHRPDAADTPRPVLLWMHGGGLLFGDARQDDPFVRRVVDELGLAVVSVQYRCAPGAPFPTPLDDCAQAFRWLSTQPWVHSARIVVGGASAGGHLAAALAQRLCAVEGATPVFQLLVYPMLDDRSADGSGPNDPWFRLWDRRANQLGWTGYLADHDREDPPPFAVPSRTADLSRLPPAWIGVGTLDLFHDEDRAYAERLEAAGVPVTLEVVEGAYHGFDAVQASAPVARRFRDAQLAALAAHVAG